MEKKYKLINGLYSGLYQIEALKDFEVQGRKVHKGQLGGHVSSEDNLSQSGNCWIFDDAIVKDWAKLSGDAIATNKCLIKDHAIVDGNVSVYGDAIIRGYAQVHDEVEVYSSSVIADHSIVTDNACIFGGNLYDNARIKDNAEINGIVRGNAEVRDNAYIGCHAEVSDDAKCFGNAKIDFENNGYIKICGSAMVYGNAEINGKNIVIGGDAKITNKVYTNRHIYHGFYY